MQWIRESNLIEGIDDPLEDARSQRAWKELQTKNWSVGTILWLHRRLLYVLNRRIAGKWRTCMVRIGQHVPCHWSYVPQQMAVWTWNNTCLMDKSPRDIQEAHVEFERIHPFEDGNGRVGRMLMNWQLVRLGYEPMCIKASERQEYYKWFAEVPKP